MEFREWGLDLNILKLSNLKKNSVAPDGVDTRTDPSGEDEGELVPPLMDGGVLVGVRD